MFSSSSHPSAPPLVDQTETHGSYPDWIILDTLAGGANYRWKSLTSAKAFASSGTTAKAVVKYEKEMGVVMQVDVEVSVQLLNPPDVSSFVVQSSGLRDDGMPLNASIVSVGGDMVLLYIIFERYKPGLYFVYRVGNGNPSLEVLPRPSRSFNPTQSVGILPLGCGGSEGYLVAAFICLRVIEDVFICELCLYSSKTKAWSTKLPPLVYDCDTDWNAVRNHSTDKVIIVGRDSLGWVDLWWGMVVCNFVEEQEPVVRFIEMPDPMPGNEDNFGTSYGPSCRDVICIGDMIKLVEIDYHRSAYGVSLGYPITDFGWKAKIYCWMLSSEDWHDCSTVDTADILVNNKVFSLFPGMRDEKVETPLLNKLISYSPTLSMKNNVLYMLCKLNLDPRNPVAWLAAVDIEKKTVELVSFTAEIMSHGKPFHFLRAFSKLLT